MKVMTFLDNAPRGAKRHRKRHRARASARRPRKHKRQPPLGFSSWKAYMDSIRPGGRKTKTRRGGGMAHHKRKTRKNAAHHAKKHRRRSPRRGVKEFLAIPLRKRARRNPQGLRHIGKGLANVPRFAMQTTVAAAEGIGGKIGTRKLRALVTKSAPGSMPATLWEILFAQLQGLVLTFVQPELGFHWAMGGMMAPGETLLQQHSPSFVSSALGDDGFLIGPGTGVMLVSAHPADYTGAVKSPTALPSGAPDNLADYVSGREQIADYVTGGGGLHDYVSGTGDDAAAYTL